MASPFWCGGSPQCILTAALGVQPTSLLAWTSWWPCSPSISTLLRLNFQNLKVIMSLHCIATHFVQFKLWPHLFLDLALNFYSFPCIYAALFAQNAPNIQGIASMLQHSCNLLLDASHSQVQRRTSHPPCSHSCCLFSVLALGPFSLVLSVWFRSVALDRKSSARTVLPIFFFFFCYLICI